MKLNFIKHLTIVLFAIWVASCKVGPNAEKPEIDSPEKFRFDTTAVQDSALNLKWWEIFHDETLDSLIEVALDSNYDVRIAAKRIEQYRAALNFTKADLFPSITYNGSGKAGTFTIFRTPDIESNWSAGAQLAWELDFWGKFRRANESARAELLATEFAHRQIQLDIITGVANTYYQLLDYKARLEISRKTLALRDSSERIIEFRFKNGVIPELDLNQAQIQTALAEAAIPEYERSVAGSEHALSILLGQNPQAIEVSMDAFNQENIDSIPSGIPSSILTRRPDILQQEQMVYAQNAKVGVAVAQRFPAISLTGLLGTAGSSLASFNASGIAWNVGGGLFGPIFEFGKNKRRVEVEKFKTEQEVLKYEKTVINAFQEVENALIYLKTYKDQLKARKKQVDAALNARYLAELRYDKGVTSYLEVIEYQRSAFDAELTYAQTRRLYIESFIQLYKVLGGGWVSPEEEANQNEE